MERCREFIDQICANDATIQAVAVIITLGRWFVGLCHDAIDSGRIVRRWWERRGQYIAAAVFAMAVTVVSVLVAVTFATVRWVRSYGLPAVLVGLDRGALLFFAMRRVSLAPSPHSHPLAR